LNNKCGEIGPRQGAKRSKAEALRAFETPYRADFHHIYSTNLQFRTLAKHTKVSDATQAAGYGTGAGVIGAPGVVGITGCTLPPHPAVELRVQATDPWAPPQPGRTLAASAMQALYL
jgi:hypothetical protein